MRRSCHIAKDVLRLWPMIKADLPSTGHRGRGHVVNISLGSGWVTYPDFGFYDAAKFGMNSGKAL